METKEIALYKKLKTIFIVSLVIIVVSFLFILDYTIRHSISDPNVMLEQYAIVFTIACIPGTLKLFRYLLKKQDKSNTEEYLKKFTLYYFIRLGILELVCIFNIVSLYITGSKNFMFMTIITIFALFFCFPTKKFEKQKSDESEK